MSDAVRFERIGDHVAVVTLNRPEKLNAVNRAVTEGLDAAVRRVEADDMLRVAVLASSNDRVFCAGADLAAVAAGRGADLFTPEGGFAGFVRQERSKPWIAAVAGAAVGGGLELCLACDLIVGGETSRFGLPEVRRGVVAAAGGVTRLPKVVPRAIALEILITGEPIDAAQAYNVGLINRVVPNDQVLAAALVLAESIAANAPIAVRESMAIARRSLMLDEAEGWAETEAMMARISTTEDFIEGPRAFVEKRAPVWTGR